MPHPPDPNLMLSRRLRQTPFEQRVIEQGARAFTVYNHTLLATFYRSVEEDYEHLCRYVQVWDVAGERQVEVVGPDALQLVELMTPRDISICEVGQCVYAPLVDEHGGIVNDPVILKLAADRYWISIADSDVLLWAKGLAAGRHFKVSVFEPDVSPLAVQGPLADDLMADLIDESVRDIKLFRFIETRICATSVLLARSGWSGQGGFEIYLQDHAKGIEVWDAVCNAGEKYNIRAGCPNLIDRIEKGLYSYGNDMTLANNVYECGLERFIDEDKAAEYLGREAMQDIRDAGIANRLVNLAIDGEPLRPPRSVWPVLNDQGQQAGMVTSLAYSRKYAANLAFAMVRSQWADYDRLLKVRVSDGSIRSAHVRNRQWR